MQVTVDIPEPLANTLKDRARRLGLDVDEVIVVALAHDAGQPYLPATRTIHERVVQLVKQGYSDADIAGFTGYTPGWVANIRRTAQLPANRRYHRPDPQPAARHE